MKRGVTAGWLAAWCVAAVAADAPDALEGARRAIEARQPEAALRALGQHERDEAAAGRSAEPNFLALFFRGAGQQQRAGEAAGGERAEALALARTAYTQALQLRPANATVMTNLALLETTAGDAAAAGRWYAQAAEQPGTRAGLFALNYARHLETIGEMAGARSWAARAVERAPDNEYARRELARLHGQEGPAALARHLAGALGEGHSLFSFQTALGALAAPPAGPNNAPAAATAAGRWALLMLAATALEQDAGLRRLAVADASTRQPLAALRDDAQLGQAVRQLGLVLVDPPATAEGVSAWLGRDRPLRELPQHTRGTMRRLAMALAGTAAAASPDGNVAPAAAARSERLWRLAIELGDQGPDPDAFIGLVGQYASLNQLDRLSPLMNRYEQELFSEKGGAIGSGNHELAFRMHLALGLSYGYLKVWRSAGSPYRNAVYQLEAAMRTAELADRSGPKPPERLALPPVALDQLFEGRVARGESTRGRQEQLAGAMRLLEVGRLSEAGLVVKAIPFEAIQELGGDATRRWEGIKDRTREGRV